VLIILVLTAVGLYAIQTSRNELLLTLNQNYGQQAEYLAESGIQATANFLSDPRRAQLVLAHLVLERTSTITLSSGQTPTNPACLQPHTTCLTTTTFFPNSTTSTNPQLPHRGFRLDSLIHYSQTRPTNNTAIPPLHGEFLVMLNQPVKSSFSSPLAGYSFNPGISQQCTYTITLTSTGYVRNYSVAANAQRQDLRTLGEKTLRAFLQVQAVGSVCNM
jgi:hypothetical protein